MKIPRIKIRSATALALFALVLGFLAVSPASAQGGAEGGSDSTGEKLTDFKDTVSVPGFDTSLGELTKVTVTATGDFDSTITSITNTGASAADTKVTATGAVCVQPKDPATTFTYFSCESDSAAVAATEVIFEETFSLSRGETRLIDRTHMVTASSTEMFTAQAEFTAFKDVASVDFDVATLVEQTFQGGGGNIELAMVTKADVSVAVRYDYISVDLDKRTRLAGTGEGVDGLEVAVGEAIEWVYDVTNTGTANITNIVVSDSIEPGAPTCDRTTLAPGESTRCILAGVATEGPYENTGQVTVSSVDDTQITVSAEDPSSYDQAPPPTPTPEPTSTPAPTATPVPVSPHLYESPAIDIELDTNGSDADSPSGPTIAQGGDAIWTYKVTNTGTVNLRDVVVTDGLGNTVCVIGELAYAHSTSCTVPGTVQCSVARRDSTVVGFSPSGIRVTDADPTHWNPDCDPEPVVDEVQGTTLVRDDVLAHTGDSGNGPATIAMIVSGVGLVLLSGSEALRRRHNSLRN